MKKIIIFGFACMIMAFGSSARSANRRTLCARITSPVFAGLRMARMSTVESAPGTTAKKAVARSHLAWRIRNVTQATMTSATVAMRLAMLTGHLNMLAMVSGVNAVPMDIPISAKRGLRAAAGRATGALSIASNATEIMLPVSQAAGKCI